MTAHVVTSLARDDLWRVDEDRTLSHPAKRVYRVLYRTAAAIGSAELAVTAAAVAERIGASDPRTARRALDELARQDLLAAVDRDRRRGTLLVTVFGPYPGQATPLPDPQKRFAFDRADKLAQDRPPDGQECSPTDKRAQDCPPKSGGGPGSEPDARGSLLSSLFSSSTRSEEREIDWTAAMKCYLRARQRMLGDSPISPRLSRLLLQAAGLAVAALGTSWLAEAVAIAARKKPTDPATYLRAVLTNLAWERAYGREPEDDAEKTRARSWLRRELAAIDAAIPPPVELRRLAAEAQENGVSGHSPNHETQDLPSGP